MLAYIAFAVVLIITFYTVLFAVENFRNQNFLGFWAVLLLALATVALPFFMLFLFH